MSVLLFANDATSTLAGAINNAAVVAQLAPGTGARFPNPAAGQSFRATLIDVATGLLKEILDVTARAGDQVTITRAQEGTVALAWGAGDLFTHYCTAGTLAQMLQQAQAFPARTVTTAAGAFALTNADGYVNLSRTGGGVGASNTVLPPAPTNGQIVGICDGIGNFQAAPVTVAPNVGQSIANLPGNAVLNVNRQRAIFQWFADANEWSFSP